jgi:hypothetical protein
MPISRIGSKEWWSPPERGLAVAVESVTAEPVTDPSGQLRRWRAPLAIAALGGLMLALLTGSVLLFFLLVPGTRDYWILAHWVLALVALLPYSVYQLRHYLRVRPFARQVHYRVGLHAFLLLCGAAITGLLLVTPLHAGTTAYSVVDLMHIFCSYGFTLLVSAHLTLVALRTLALAGPDLRSYSVASIQRLFVVAGVLATAALLALLLLS